MQGWAALLGPEQDAAGLAAKRADAAKQFGIQTFTCDDCPAQSTCEWAFDPYNTNDDCLAMK